MGFSIIPWQSTGPATISVHTQTAQIVVQECAASANVLIGHVSVVVQRPTTVASLDVEFSGRQTLDWRQGEGPSAAIHTLRHNCADITHRLLDGSDSGAAATAAAAKLLGSQCASSVSVHTLDSYQLLQYSPPNVSRQSTSGEPHPTVAHNATLVLGPGEYRFAFEFVVPDSLPASVSSPLGGVSFAVSATLKRSWYQAAITSPAACIDVVRAPPTSSTRGERLLLGFTSLPALASAPLLFKAPIGKHWDVTVYAPSHALFLGNAAQIQVFATRNDTTQDTVELIELSATLSERILHRVPHGTAQRATEKVVAASALNDQEGKAEARVLRHQQFDAQSIHALGDSFAELLLSPALRFALPRTDMKSGRRAQPSSASPLFSVSHELRISVAVRVPDENEYRMSFSAPVLVLPEALAGSHGAPSPLPRYASISKDIVLAAEVASSLASIDTYPPDYNTLYI